MTYIGPEKEHIQNEKGEWFTVSNDAPGDKLNSLPSSSSTGDKKKEDSSNTDDKGKTKAMAEKIKKGKIRANVEEILKNMSSTDREPRIPPGLNNYLAKRIPEIPRLNLKVPWHCRQGN